jgi:hypothetical protein
MKYKIIALILALTIVSWAQTATQNAPATAQQSAAPAEKGKCPCCDKMAADSKDNPACCAHRAQHSGNAKEVASCCSGKDGKSCCGGDAKSCPRGDKDKTAKSCCGDSCCKDKMAAAGCADCCKDCEKCNKKEKTASNCCDHDLRSQNEPIHPFAEAGK